MSPSENRGKDKDIFIPVTRREERVEGERKRLDGLQDRSEGVWRRKYLFPLPGFEYRTVPSATSRFSITKIQPTFKYKYASYNDVSVNDGPHIRR